MLRFFIRLSILVRTSIKWSNKLLKVPQPNAEKDLQRALTSAVETEFEIEYENAQMANTLTSVTYNHNILLFA